MPNPTIYTCIYVHTVCGSHVYRNFCLLIEVSLTIVEGVVKGYFTSGRRVQLRCDFDTTFQFITFKHKNKQKVSGGRISVNTTSNQSLLIISSTEPGDAGIWSCVVQKKRGGAQVFRQAALTYMG